MRGPSRSDIIKEMKRVRRELGAQYSRRQFDEQSTISSRTIERKFGSWTEAVASAKIKRKAEKSVKIGKKRRAKSAEPVSESRRYSEEQIDFIVKARLTQALGFVEIAKAFEKKWGGDRTSEQMRHAYRTHAQVAVIDTEGEVEEHPYTDFTRSSFEGVRKSTSKRKGRWFITSAMPVSHLSPLSKCREFSENLYRPGFKAVQTWMKHKDGELVILPMRAHMPALKGQPSHYDAELIEHLDAFANEFSFNDYLRALDVHLNPQQIHPLTSLHRIRGGKPQVIVDGKVLPTRFNQSLIFAHAKQDMEPVATGNGTLARFLYSTGTISLPEYLPNRIGMIATDGHVLGGLIVEVDGDKFWVRQIQFGADGSFCDIDGNQYCPDGEVRKAKCAALRMGDLHGGLEDIAVIDAQARLAGVAGPDEVFVEDVFDGSSASHHTENRRLTRALSKHRFKSIQAEFDHDRELLDMLNGRFGGRIVIVASNHHDVVYKYLDDGRYMKDDANFELAHRMVVELFDGIDPMKKRLDPQNQYDWLNGETDRYVQGVQMGSHGHLGVDGARGSPDKLEQTFGSAMIGHLHAPRIVGKLCVVGHSSLPRHGYNRGPSRWAPCPGLVWEGGQKQLVMIIDGRYGLDDPG